MSGFLEGLGAKIAERWLSLLALPGLLWVSCAVLGGQLGWRHALDLRIAGDRIPRWAGEDHSVGQVVLVLAGVLLASAAAGLTANATAALVRRCWLLPGRRPPARWLRTVRHRRWDIRDRRVRSAETDAFRTAEGPAVAAGPEISEALARRDAISLKESRRPTWIGDRWLANTQRVHDAYGLDLTVAWPRLWTVLPEPLRNDITAAQTSYTAASLVVAWGILYGLLGLFWGPVLLIAGVTVFTGTFRARTATTTVCQLVETAADLYGPTLAEQLHIPCPGPLTRTIGGKITEMLRKD